MSWAGWTAVTSILSCLLDQHAEPSKHAQRRDRRSRRQVTQQQAAGRRPGKARRPANCATGRAGQAEHAERALLLELQEALLQGPKPGQDESYAAAARRAGRGTARRAHPAAGSAGGTAAGRSGWAGRPASRWRAASCAAWRASGSSPRSGCAPAAPAQRAQLCQALQARGEGGAAWLQWTEVHGPEFGMCAPRQHPCTGRVSEPNTRQAGQAVEQLLQKLTGRAHAALALPAAPAALHVACSPSRACS